MPIKGLSRAEIDKKLHALAKSATPKELAPGAMCYSPCFQPDRVEYICPSCGETTLYAGEKVCSMEEIQAARRVIKELQEVAGEGLNLDESQFCLSCSPRAIGLPKLVLKIQYDLETSEVAEINSDDLILLVEFFSDKLVHDAGSDGEKPLKDYINRLRELLQLN